MFNTLKILKTMKKIKLFALALFAMLSTNAFADFTPYEDANTVFRFQVTAEQDGANPGTATILGFVADYTAVATTKIPATVNSAKTGKSYNVNAINGAAFENKAITTLDLSEATNLVTIGAGAFAGTGITSLDLSKTKVAELNPLFETTNTKVTTVTLPTTLTTIKASAFAGMGALTTITFTAQAAGKAYGLTIEGYAFKNTMKLTSLELPATVKWIKANAFANTYLTSLTIGGTMPAFSATEGAEAGVEAGAFVRNGEQTLAITYKPVKGAGYVNPFATTEGESKCFAAAYSALPKDLWVSFITDTEFNNFLAATITKFDGVNLSAIVAPDGKIPVANNGSGSYYYAGFISPAKAGTTDIAGIKIAKLQGENKDINVMVYGAYFDDCGTAASSAILMDQMHLIGGYYYIPKGVPFIVKSSSDADVEYYSMTTMTAAQNSQNYAKGGDISQNKIQIFYGASAPEGNIQYGKGLTDEIFAIDLINVYKAGKQTIFFLRDIATKGFGWKQKNDDSVVKKGQLFLLYPEAAAAEVRVIWLDGSEEDQVTAIQTVKSAKAENGAIYNLAGQKVNASYKGVVIKDGKKFIQK